MDIPANHGRQDRFLRIEHCGTEQCIPNDFRSHSAWKSYLIHFVFEGKGTLFANNKSFAMEKGDAFFLFPGDEAEHIADQAQPWRYGWIGFSGSFAHEIAYRLDLNRDFPCYRVESIDLARAKLEEIIAADGRRDNLYALGNLLQLISLLKKDARVRNLSPQAYTYFKRATDYIAANLEKKLDVEDIAASVGLCRSQVFRVFKSVADVSVTEWIRRERVDLAKYMLASNNRDLLDIALSVGFTDVEHMRRSFLKVTGRTPRAFLSTRQVEAPDD